MEREEHSLYTKRRAAVILEYREAVMRCTLLRRVGEWLCVNLGLLRIWVCAASGKGRMHRFKHDLEYINTMEGCIIPAVAAMHEW